MWQLLTEQKLQRENVTLYRTKPAKVTASKLLENIKIVFTYKTNVPQKLRKVWRNQVVVGVRLRAEAPSQEKLQVTVFQKYFWVFFEKKKLCFTTLPRSFCRVLGEPLSLTRKHSSKDFDLKVSKTYSLFSKNVFGARTFASTWPRKKHILISGISSKNSLVVGRVFFTKKRFLLTKINIPPSARRRLSNSG